MGLLRMVDQDPILCNRGRFLPMALHSSLSSSEQRRVFKPSPSVWRRGFNARCSHVCFVQQMRKIIFSVWIF
jgi:hypothetical protein